MEFTWADYGIIILLALSILISVIRGFVREALSLATWLIAFWAALYFLDDMRTLLSQYIHTASVLSGVAFLTLFVTVLIIGHIISYLLGKMITATGLSGTDRVLGSVFGFSRGVLLTAVFLLLASFTPVTQDPWWQNSVLIPQFESLVIWLQDMLPDTIDNPLQQIKSI